jgi:hypothetical protein
VFELKMARLAAVRSSASAWCGLWGRSGATGAISFEAPMMPAPAYRVRVFSDDRVESGGLIRWPFR